MVDWAELPARYLAHLLRAVLTGPGADAQPAASELAADLLVALAESGAGDAAAWALTTRPGFDAFYEVRSFVSGDLDPADPFATDDPDAAILEARDRALDAGRSVELLSRDRLGLQRSVLAQTAIGLRYRFPELACFDAPGAGLAALGDAVVQWQAVLQPAATATATVSSPPALAEILASLIPTAVEVADVVVERLVAHFEGDAAG